MTNTYTFGELEASELLSSGYCTTNDGRDPHWAGNQIIALAERIKAERAVVAMNPYVSTTEKPK